MCLDNKAAYYLDNIPWNKCKVLSGEIEIHVQRQEEKQTINQVRFAHTHGGIGVNNIDKKIMWKIEYTERDYN